MAKLSTLGGDGKLLAGEDKDVTMEVLTRAGVPVDVAGWTTSLVLTTDLTGAAVLTKAGSVTGTYSATRSVNTQRLVFELLDTETDDLLAGTYHWSIKRTDAGSEVVLGWGVCQVERANQI